MSISVQRCAKQFVKVISTNLSLEQANLKIVKFKRSEVVCK